MNKEIAESIRMIGRGYMALADALLLPETDAPAEAHTESPEEVEKPKTTKKARKKKESESEQKHEPITHEQLREFLGNLAASGHSDEVAALLKEYGEGKLSTVPESNYQALYDAAQGVAVDAGGDTDA